MPIKLKDIEGLLPEKKDVNFGGMLLNAYQNQSFNKCLAEIGEKTLELNQEVLLALIRYSTLAYASNKEWDNDLSEAISTNLGKIILVSKSKEPLSDE